MNMSLTKETNNRIFLIISVSVGSLGRSAVRQSRRFVVKMNKWKENDGLFPCPLCSYTSDTNDLFFQDIVSQIITSLNVTEASRMIKLLLDRYGFRVRTVLGLMRVLVSFSYCLGFGIVQY